MSKTKTAEFALTCLLLLSTSAQVPGQVVDEASPRTSEASVVTQVFQPVRRKSQIFADYPDALRANYEEGWVQLSFMVSSEGKPYEIHVSRSVGSKEFEKSALRAIEQASFEPALLDGKPIDSATGVKVEFYLPLHGRQGGARPAFIDYYRALERALDKRDRAAADAARAKLQVTNLYEDAYLGIAEYEYAVRWGDENQQLSGLQRAVAAESTAQYLPKPLFTSALYTMLQLDVKRKDYADAMSIWELLKKNDTDKRSLADLQPMIDQMEALRTDNRAYEVPGQIVDSYWLYRLFKNTFHIAISEGRISEMKLLCERRFVVLKFDPELEYRVSTKYGACSLAVAGDPATKFRLIQY